MKTVEVNSGTPYWILSEQTNSEGKKKKGEVSFSSATRISYWNQWRKPEWENKHTGARATKIFFFLCQQIRFLFDSGKQENIFDGCVLEPSPFFDFLLRAHFIRRARRRKRDGMHKGDGPGKGAQHSCQDSRWSIIWPQPKGRKSSWKWVVALYCQRPLSLSSLSCLIRTLTAKPGPTAHRMAANPIWNCWSTR